MPKALEVFLVASVLVWVVSLDVFIIWSGIDMFIEKIRKRRKKADDDPLFRY